MQATAQRHHLPASSAPILLLYQIMNCIGIKYHGQPFGLLRDRREISSVRMGPLSTCSRGPLTFNYEVVFLHFGALDP